MVVGAACAESAHELPQLGEFRGKLQRQRDGVCEAGAIVQQPLERRAISRARTLRRRDQCIHHP